MGKLLSVVDLFSGAGGLSLGFEMAGFSILGAIEQDKWAAETFQRNHPTAKVISSDIRNVTNDALKQTFGAPDVVVGGPPCQGYSVCTKNAGDPKDPKNTLFREFLRAVKVLSPKIVVMENVPNLIKAKTSKNEEVVKIITHELIAADYYVNFDILKAVEFGVPQIRERLFIIGSKVRLNEYFPKPSHSENTYVTLWDAISDLPDIDSREGKEEMNYTKQPANEFQQRMREESRIVHNHVSMKHSKRTVERFKVMKWGDSVSDVPAHLKPYKRGSNGLLSEKTYDQNNRRMHPNKPCHTLPASFYANFVHPYKHRNFTAREGARIQTFPDRYIFYGKPTVVSHKLLEREERHDENYLCQYNQIGNAVPPLLAKAIALNIKEQIFG